MEGLRPRGGRHFEVDDANVPPPPLPAGDKLFSIEGLRQYASVEGPLYMSLLGRVYDVSKGADFFGPKGPYGMFAYHDGTYNLAGPLCITMHCT